MAYKKSMIYRLYFDLVHCGAYSFFLWMPLKKTVSTRITAHIYNVCSFHFASYKVCLNLKTVPASDEVYPVTKTTPKERVLSWS